MPTLKDKIAQIPGSPGVYFFKDKEGIIIYIGKAKSLKKRVQSYFSRLLDSKTQALVSKITDVEYRLTDTESQAQILEAALIKENLPQYNIDLKDDKSFPWIRITDEAFPVVSIYRRKKFAPGDTSVYFGPYTNVKALRQAIKLIRKIFGFRSCKKLPKHACLYHRIKLCPAPCIGAVSSRAYRENIEEIGMFLGSRYEELIGRLSIEMKKAAAEKRFEDAAAIRDKVQALGSIGHRRTGFSRKAELEDLRDVLALDVLPARIEAFDISNISGEQATGSCVSFYNGEPDKNNYRKFRIKTVKAIDDYGMLREVVLRRYSRLKRENAALPDLVLIDGGRGHLLAAQGVMKELGVTLPLVSIAKQRENIYTVSRRYPIKFKEDTPALNLIRRVRDEAHRFAVSYHHVLRRKKVIGK
ncbi:MAG: excinuclease ABC subunit UvrC [Candidatus Omnitrophota bacterium]